jgi:hypothetical protein
MLVELRIRGARFWRGAWSSLFRPAGNRPSLKRSHPFWSALQRYSSHLFESKRSPARFIASIFFGPLCVFSSRLSWRIVDSRPRIGTGSAHVSSNMLLLRQVRDDLVPVSQFVVGYICSVATARNCL